MSLFREANCYADMLTIMTCDLDVDFVMFEQKPTQLSQSFDCSLELSYPRNRHLLFKPLIFAKYTSIFLFYVLIIHYTLFH